MIGYELLAKITSVSRELQDFENVHKWGNQTINLESECGRTLRLEKEWDVEINKALYTAHYSKAFAFQQHGRIHRAIRHYETALKYNPECYTTAGQLHVLRQTGNLADSAWLFEEDTNGSCELG